MGAKNRLPDPTCDATTSRTTRTTTPTNQPLSLRCPYCDDRLETFTAWYPEREPFNCSEPCLPANDVVIVNTDIERAGWAID